MCYNAGMTQETLFQELYSRYGAVKRARGPFLYTERGVRIVDMYQENGRAVLGWGGGSAFTHLKNVLSRGLTGSYRTVFSFQLAKALEALLGGKRKVYVFSSKARAMEAALNVSKDNTAFYMPWGAVTDFSKVDAVVVAPPLPWTQDIYILSVLDSVQNELILAHIARNFSCAVLPAVLEAAVCRSVYNLVAELPVRQEKDWFVYDQALTPYWERRGPYLFPRENVLDAGNYDAFVMHCLDCGVLVAPEFRARSIVPYGADRGVFAKLVKNPFNVSDI